MAGHETKPPSSTLTITAAVCITEPHRVPESDFEHVIATGRLYVRRIRTGFASVSATNSKASMPHVKSPYPPVPDLPNLNYFSLLFETSPGKDHPRDYVIHVDVETGEQRTYGEFLDRTRDCATGLAASVEQGGLGIRYAENTEQEIIVIFSPNSMVSYAVAFVVRSMLVTCG